MDFSIVKNEAAQFIEKHKDMEMACWDRDKKQIDFTFQNDSYSFFISCPDQDNAEWTVWSQSEKCQQLLQTALIDLDKRPGRRITEVLEFLNKSLTKISSESKLKEEKDDSSNDDDTDDDCDYDEGFDIDDDLDELDQATSEKDGVDTSLYESTGNPTAVRRLIKDLKSIKNTNTDLGFAGEPRNNNLFIWDVELTNIPTDTTLGKDLIKYQKDFNEKAVIKLEVQFPDDYPFAPPFIRVVKPRFQFLTGHITIGGSICMQALTKSGWCPVNDLESILIQVRAEILSDPKACLDKHRSNVGYTPDEAKSAFHRMVQKYGWDKH